MKTYFMQYISVETPTYVDYISDDDMKKLVSNYTKKKLNGVDVGDIIFDAHYYLSHDKEMSVIRYSLLEKIEIDENIHNKLFLLNKDYHTNSENTLNKRRWRLVKNSYLCLIIDEYFD